MKLNLLLAVLLSSLSVACYAADAVSGATPNHAAPGSQIKNVDAVTSASIVPQSRLKPQALQTAKQIRYFLLSVIRALTNH